MPSLRYLGTPEGEVIKAIAVHGFYEWGEIRDLLGLSNDALRPIIRKLKREGVIEENNSHFRVENKLWLAYKAHHGDEWAKKKLIEAVKDLVQNSPEIQTLMTNRPNLELKNRLQQYIEFTKIDVPLDTTDIFLQGHQLDSLLKDLIPLAKLQILVVNPFVEKCAICDMLLSAAKRGVSVKIVTQSPEKDYENRRKRAKVRYHKKIRESEAELFYNNSVHAKVFVIDSQVLTNSSMNLYTDSTSGKLWETGIVSVNDSNVSLAKKALIQLFDDPDTIMQVESNTFKGNE